MSDEDLWNLEEWSVAERVGLFVFLLTLVVASLTGWALIPMFMFEVAVAVVYLVLREGYRTWLSRV